MVHENIEKIDTSFTANSQCLKDLKMAIKAESTLSQLENEISQLNENGDLSDPRTAFEIGVKFGREIQKGNIEIYECAFWKNRDISVKLQNAKSKEIEKINHVFRSLILKSINNKIDELGSWSISDRDSDLRWSKFSDETVEKYNIQYAGTRTNSYEFFECAFMATGKLKDLLNSYEVGEKIDAALTNPSGDSYIDIDCEIFVSKNLYRVNSCLEYKRNWPLEKFKEFNEALVKLFLFELLK
jgi:hypothetical protein